jgi:hypothetical protein
MGMLAWHDRVFAWLLQPWHARLFPVACDLARSLRDEPDQWTFERNQMIHTPTGIKIKAYGGEAFSVELETREGNWKPDMVSRRIIRNALDQRALLLLTELSKTYFVPVVPAKYLQVTHQPSGTILNEGATYVPNVNSRKFRGSQ